MFDLLFNDPQLFWSIVLSILSTLLVIVSVVISVLTLRQSRRMIESSTRPYIGVSSLQVNNGSPVFAFVVKNYGASSGVVVSFQCDHDLADFALGDERRSLYQGIEGTMLMPGQKIVCSADCRKMHAKGIDTLKFTVEYLSDEKRYSDISTVGVSMNANIVHARTSSKDPLKNISSALQAIAERMD